jgi:hypothetical protein
MSDMVYTALQLVTRGREKGISVVDLGKKSGYDQKTCFYLVKQLLDMDLVYVVQPRVLRFLLMHILFVL